ncbi:MAG: NifU family protein [Bacteroidetes bacterium]|nr:MAG: NifU family protein [Bacteroidota bacterium]
MEKKKIPTAVYAEMTPNPSVMKFVVDRDLVSGLHQLEFMSAEEAKVCSPLATELFHFPFVSAVFISGTIVSVTKDESLGWEMIVMQLREYIREWLEENEHAVEDDKVALLSNYDESGNTDNKSILDPAEFITANDISVSEYDEAIVGLLNEFVRPAVEQDGGAIHFVGFKEGVVYVQLKGACAGCPSSTETLKGGIETLLISKLSEVKEVVAMS